LLFLPVASVYALAQEIGFPCGKDFTERKLMRFSGNKLLTNFCYSLALALLFCLLTYPVFNTPFSIGDDHRIIAMNSPEKMESAYTKALFGKEAGLSGSVAIDAAIGRFRPAGWLWVKTQCLLFGENHIGWRVMNIFILLFSVFFLSLIIGKLGAKGGASLCVLAVYVFGRNNETWWTLIPPAQNVGELLLLGGFYSWLLFREKNKLSYRTIALACFLLSALVKESFIFCIPFIGLVDFLFLNPNKKLLLPEYKYLSFVFFIPFGFLVGIILFSKKIYGYPYECSMLSIFAYNALQFFFSSVFLFAPLILFFFRSHVITRRNLVKLLFITLSWFLVQLILLKSIRMDDQHHYLVPGILFVMVISALALEQLKRRSKMLRRSLVWVYLLFAVWQAKNTFVNAGFYSAQVKSFYDMTNAIKTSSPGKIIYMTEQAAAGDWLMGTSAIFRSAGITAPLYFCSVADSVPEWQKEFLKQKPHLTFSKLEFDELKLEKGDWLVYPDEPINNPSMIFKRGVIPPEYIGGKLIRLEFFENRYYNLPLSQLPKWDNLSGWNNIIGTVGYHAKIVD
jgi:hypothetical protein